MQNRRRFQRMLEQEQEEKERRERLERTDVNFPVLGNVPTKQTSTWTRSFKDLALQQPEIEENEEVLDEPHVRVFRPHASIVAPVSEPEPEPEPTPTQPADEWVTVNRTAKKDAQRKRREQRKEERMEQLHEDDLSSESEEETCWDDGPATHETCWEEERYR